MTHGRGTDVSAWPIGDGNGAYLDKTLCYMDVEMTLSEGVSWRTLWHLWLRAGLAGATVWIIFLVPATIVGVSGDTEPGALLPAGTGPAFTVLTFGALLSFITFLFVLLFSNLKEPIAEWRVLLADRADCADSVYSQISGTLTVRRMPMGWEVRRIRTGPGPADVSNRLVLRYATYTAYVSVFPYGTSLYLGWTMWRSRHGARLVGQFLRDLGQGLTGTNDPERQMLRTEGARAMREAVHAACREGLFVAVEGVDVPVEYGFPYGLPVVQDELAVAPVPGAQPPPVSAPTPQAPGSW
jgi:hypothetical protein